MPQSTKTNKSKQRLIKKIQRREKSFGLKEWLEKNVSKKQITPALEFLTGAYEQESGYTPSGFEAAMSVPVLGSIKKSKDLVKLYRGIDKWHKGQQVKKGMHVGGITKNTYAEMSKSNPGLAKRMLEKFSKNIYTTTDKKFAEFFANLKGSKGKILEYEVPKKYVEKYGIKSNVDSEVLFEKGIPKEFFKKVR